MIKVNVLGFWGTFPSAGGATSGFLVTGKNGQLLLDCGSGVMSRMPFYTNVESVSAVLLTHLHFDHMCDVGILQYAANFAIRNRKKKEKLQIYSPSEPADIWQTLKGENVDLHNIEDNLNINIAGMNISFMAVNHTIPCYAIRIEQDETVVTYITDTVYMETLSDFCRDSDLLICGAAVSSESRHTTGKGHMNALQAGQIAREGNVKRLLLSHISHDCDIEQLRKNASDSYGNEVFLANIKSEYTIDRNEL